MIRQIDGFLAQAQVELLVLRAVPTVHPEVVLLRRSMERVHVDGGDAIVVAIEFKHIHHAMEDAHERLHTLHAHRGVGARAQVCQVATSLGLINAAAHVVKRDRCARTLDLALFAPI